MDWNMHVLEKYISQNTEILLKFKLAIIVALKGKPHIHWEKRN